MLKYVFDKNTVNEQLVLLSNLLEEQRKQKKTLLSYLEKVSEHISNTTNIEDSEALVSSLSNVQEIFDNIKSNIDKLLELKLFIENISKSTSLNVIDFQKYHNQFTELSEKIELTNNSYNCFMEKLTSIPSIDFSDLNYKDEITIEKVSNKENVIRENSVEETTTENLENNVLANENILEAESNIETSAEQPVIEEISNEGPIIENVSNEETTVENLINNDLANENILEAESNIETSTEQPVIKEFSNEAPTIENVSNEETTVENLINNDLANENILETESNIETSTEQPVIKKASNEAPTIENVSNEETSVENLINNDLANKNILEAESNIETSTEQPVIEEASNEDPTIEEDSAKNNIKPNFLESTLLIGNEAQIAILPYSLLDLEEYFSENPEKYSSINDIIEKEYTVPLDNYENSSISRFKQAFKLAKEKSHFSFFEALNYANKLLFKNQVEPIVIAACCTIDELETYLDCLYDDNLKKFNCFKIISK